MIWFACKQCGKVHGRAESSSGTTIFCNCGQGNLVPWESTAPEPQKGAEPAGGPRLKPIVFESSPPPLPTGRPLSAGGRPPQREEDRPADRRGPAPAARRDRKGPRDPNACLNHDGRVKQNTCVDCGEGFCSMCLVTFQGKMLCGPCKNFRVRLLQKPRRIAFFAWFSVVASLALGPAALCFVPLGQSAWSPLWAILALVPQGLAVFLGTLGWREVEREPGLGGRGLAVTGVLCGSVTAFLIVLMSFYGARWSG